MFSFFKKKSPPAETAPASPVVAASAPTAPPAPERRSWMDKLKAGLRKTGSSISTLFTGTKIDDELYEELETALLMADTGVKATTHLLDDLKRRVHEVLADELKGPVHALALSLKAPGEGV